MRQRMSSYVRGGRPLFMSEPVCSLLQFDPSNTHQDTIVVSPDPLEIVTPAPQWSYGAWLTTGPDTSVDEARGALTITVCVTVRHGQVGVGWTRADSDQFVTEKYVDGQGEQRVTLRLLPADVPGRLMLRNASSAGPSRVVVHALEVIQGSATPPDPLDLERDVTGPPPSTAGVIVLCIGMLRSGSTWSYNLVRDLLKGAQYSGVEGGYRDSLAEWLTADVGNRSAVVKTHAPDSESLAALENVSQSVRAIFTYRDAGPAIASSVRAFGHEFETQAGAVATAIDTYIDISIRWPTLAVRYSEIGNEDAVRSIADFLGLTLPEAMVAPIKARNSREAATLRLQGVDWQAAVGIHRDERYTFHKESLLHRTHFSDPQQARERFAPTPERDEILRHLERRYRAAGLFVGPDFYSRID
jgi:hypothetical protein